MVLPSWGICSSAQGSFRSLGEVTRGFHTLGKPLTKTLKEAFKVAHSYRARNCSTDSLRDGGPHGTRSSDLEEVQAARIDGCQAAGFCRRCVDQPVNEVCLYKVDLCRNRRMI